MPTKIRLQRFGKKRHAFFHLVIADSRAPRDGKFIERIGSYNPNTNPATIEVEFEKALNWLKKGAQPTDTARAILSYSGVLYKNHLDKGVLKGAFSQEEAEAKFEKWKTEKEEKINAKRGKLSASKEEELKKRLEAEKEVNKKRAEELAAKNTPPAEETEAETTEEPATGESVDVAAQVEEGNKEETPTPPETVAEKEEEKEEPAKEENKEEKKD